MKNKKQIKTHKQRNINETQRKQRNTKKNKQ